jgi:hypothetical protein
VLVMLARAADCARVTKQYELVCKAEISPFARSGTSGVRWRAGVGPLDPGDGHLGGGLEAGDQASVTVPPTVAAYSQHRPRTDLRWWVRVATKCPVPVTGTFLREPSTV